MRAALGVSDAVPGAFYCFRRPSTPVMSKVDARKCLWAVGLGRSGAAKVGAIRDFHGSSVNSVRGQEIKGHGNFPVGHPAGLSVVTVGWEASVRHCIVVALVRAFRSAPVWPVCGLPIVQTTSCCAHQRHPLAAVLVGFTFFAAEFDRSRR
jgi:hypothetical protein